jgi:hypothetical protein
MAQELLVELAILRHKMTVTLRQLWKIRKSLVDQVLGKATKDNVG